MHFIAPQVKITGSPGFVAHPVISLVLIQTEAVKCAKTVFVLRKMCRNPVQNHADPRAVKAVHQIHKIRR